MMRSVWTNGTRWLACAALAVCVGATGGCKKEGAEGGEKAGEEKAAKPVEKKELKALFTGEKPALVGPLAKLTLNQTGDEAKKAAPEFFETKYGILDAEDFEGVSYRPDVDEKTNKLTRVSVSLPKDKALEAISLAWGKPLEAKDSIDRKELYWFNPDTGIRAVLKEGFGDDMDLEFTQYLPAKKLVGEGKDKFGFEPKPMLGMSVDDLRAAYGDQLIEQSADAAKKDREKLEKFAGKDLSALGQAQANVHIELLPTEWESFWTRVHPYLKEGKVERYTFDLSFQAFPAAKDELMGLLKAKYGEPKEIDEYGQKKLVFNENPRVVVSENDISKSWFVEVEAAAEAPATP